MRYDIIGSVQVCRGLPSFFEAIRDWFGGIIAATSAPGLGSPLSRLRRDVGTPPLPCMHATDWVQNRTASPCRPNRTYPPTSPPYPFSLPPTYRRAFLPSFISSHANAGGTLAHRHTAPNPSPPPSTPCGVCSSAAIARHTPTASPTRGRSPGSRRAYRSYRTRPKPRSPLDRARHSTDLHRACASPRVTSDALGVQWERAGRRVERSAQRRGRAHQGDQHGVDGRGHRPSASRRRRRRRRGLRGAARERQGGRRAHEHGAAVRPADGGERAAAAGGRCSC